MAQKTRREDGADYLIAAAGIAVAIGVAGIGFLENGDSKLPGILILATGGALALAFLVVGLMLYGFGESD